MWTLACVRCAGKLTLVGWVFFVWWRFGAVSTIVRLVWPESGARTDVLHGADLRVRCSRWWCQGENDDIMACFVPWSSEATQLTIVRRGVRSRKEGPTTEKWIVVRCSLAGAASSSSSLSSSSSSFSPGGNVRAQRQNDVHTYLFLSWFVFLNFFFLFTVCLIQVKLQSFAYY